MKPIYSCIAAMLMILAGAVLFLPHIMTAGFAQRSRGSGLVRNAVFTSA